jgi:hypothetical protein
MPATRSALLKVEAETAVPLGKVSRHTGLAWRRGSIATVALVGTGYAGLQALLLQRVADGIFISMLIAASIVLVNGMSRIHAHVRDRGREFFRNVFGAASAAEHDRFLRRLFPDSGLAATGVVYGTAVGSAPLVLGVWSTAVELQFALALFLFCVNYVAGVALYSLARYFLELRRLGPLMHVGIWDVATPATEFLLVTTRKVALLSCVYVSICLSSILFSEIPFTNLVMGYAAFAAAVLVSALLLPTFSIAQCIEASKTEALREVNAKIQLEFQTAIDQLRSPGETVRLERLESLLKLRQAVDSVQAWPFKAESLRTSLMVVLVSAAPVALQVILQLFVGREP